MNALSFREWIFLGICVGLALIVFLLLFAIVIALIVERIYIARRLEGALFTLSNVQKQLFLGLANAYERVETSHKLVMRAMQILDRSFGAEDEPDNPNTESETWEDVIGEQGDQSQ